MYLELYIYSRKIQGRERKSSLCELLCLKNAQQMQPKRRRSEFSHVIFYKEYRLGFFVIERSDGLI